ncbi:hypothetical protein G5B10_02125 [Fluviicola sp. SGL-29]|nr:hypothetical protein [Fluviicola sp. SGL-29]
MNSDKINRMKDAYFSGTSSKEEERQLKETSNDPFFNTLKAEQQQEMNWSFDEFLSVVEQEEPVKRVGVFTFRKMVYWAAASVAAVFFGASLFMYNSTLEKPKLVKHEVKQDPVMIPEETPDEQPTEEPTNVLPEQPVRKPKKAITYQKKKPQPSESAYNPEYVVINGKPIYDLEEAKELTMSSLNLLTSNVEKSVSSMENVKYLSIKF